MGFISSTMHCIPPYYNKTPTLLSPLAAQPLAERQSISLFPMEVLIYSFRRQCHWSVTRHIIFLCKEPSTRRAMSWEERSSRKRKWCSYLLETLFSLFSRYLIVDWERSNFSLSQCLFVENTPTKVLAINPPSATSSSNAATPKSSSSNKKTIGIAVGISIPVVFVAGTLAFCLIVRRRKPSKAVGPKSDHSVEVQPIPSSPPVNSKELDAEKTAIHELSGSHQHRQHGQTSSMAQVPSWALQHGDRSQGVEFIANQGGPGLSPSEPLLDSVHEMHGSQTTPYELAAENRIEMPGSPVTRKVSSGGASSPKRRSRRFFRFSSRRSSTQGSVPTPGSPASAAGGQTTTTSNRQSMTNSPPQESELLSPISSIVEGETAGPASLNTALIRGFSQSSRSSRRAPSVPQERLDGDTGVIWVHLPSPREVGLGLHLPNAFESKRSNGAFFANERHTRSAQYHASPKGHMGKGRGGGEFVMRRSSRTQPHTIHTHTDILALTFLHLAGQISLAQFLLRAQPTHPSTIFISIKNFLAKSAFSAKFLFTRLTLI